MVVPIIDWKRNREKAEYEKKYFSKFIVDNEKFGILCFTKDSNKNIIFIEGEQVPVFGIFRPLSWTVNCFNEETFMVLLKKIEIFYEHEADISNKLYCRLSKEFSERTFETTIEDIMEEPDLYGLTESKIVVSCFEENVVFELYVRDDFSDDTDNIKISVYVNEGNEIYFADDDE